MLHLHLLKGYGVLHLLWGYRQREIILNFQHIPSILITPKILSILNFLNFPITPIIPITLITLITQNFPTIHQKALTEKICKGFDIIILTFSVSYPSPKK